ncbi:AMP-binding protein [Actinomadura sp. SCN-SB]|uniref:AMP-binding protein n=1 Tax=Actinomadura sp. SCN-SB TaxID=3373092 RepID=UPI0037537396
MSNAPAIRSGPRARSRAEVQRRAAIIANVLQTMGIRPADRVVTVMRNDIAFVEAHLGAQLAGALPVPCNWHWSGEDLRHLLADSAAKVVFVHTDLLGPVEAVLPPDARIIEVGVPPEVAEAYALGAARTAASGRHPLLETLIAETEPITEPAERQLIGMVGRGQGPRPRLPRRLQGPPSGRPRKGTPPRGLGQAPQTPPTRPLRGEHRPHHLRTNPCG